MYLCSRAENKCPPGLECNGERCVRNASEASVRDGSDARHEASVRDGAASTDAASPAGCSAWRPGWECNWALGAETATAVCGERTVSCKDDKYPECPDPAWGCWRCTCQTPSGTTTCNGTSDLWFGCAAAEELFGKGCCKP